MKRAAAPSTPTSTPVSFPAGADGRKPPGAKRPKTRRACVSCQRQKSRCEMPAEASRSCHRCNVLGLSCSFEQEPGDPWAGLARPNQEAPSQALPYTAVAPPSPDVQPTPALLARLERVEAALSQHQALLQEHSRLLGSFDDFRTPAPTTTATPSSSSSTLPSALASDLNGAPGWPDGQPTPALPGLEGEVEAWEAPPLFARDVAGRSDADGPGNPVALGIMSQAEAAEALELFGTRYSSWNWRSPAGHYSYGDFSCTALLAIIVSSPHPPPFASPVMLARVRHLVDQHILSSTLNPRPSLDAIAAFVLLAMLHVGPRPGDSSGAADEQPSDPLMLIGLALRMATALGMDRAGMRVMRLREAGAPQAELEKELTNANMWFNIRNLDIFFILIHSPRALVPLPPQPRASEVLPLNPPECPLPVVDGRDRYIVLASALFEAATPCAHAVQDLEDCRMLDHSLDDAMRALSALEHDLDHWSADVRHTTALARVPDMATTFDLLHLEGWTVRALLVLRLMKTIRSLPSPLHPDVRDVPYARAHAAFRHATRGLFHIATNCELQCAAQHFYTTLALLCAIVLCIEIGTARGGLACPEGACDVDVGPTLSKLRAIGGWPAVCERKVRELAAHWDAEAAAAAAAAAAASEHIQPALPQPYFGPIAHAHTTFFPTGNALPLDVSGFSLEAGAPGTISAALDAPYWFPPFTIVNDAQYPGPQ